MLSIACSTPGWPRPEPAAPAGRQGGGSTVGRRSTEAARLARELELDGAFRMELRNEAIACLALADVQLVKEWEGWPSGSSGHPAFDADVEHYARSDSKGNISIRQVADDRELVLLPGEVHAGGRPGAATLRFSPQGDLLAVRYWSPWRGQTTNFRLWDWQRCATVFQPSSAVSHVEFSPDGSLLALGQDNNTVLYDVPTAQEVKRLDWGFHPGQVAFDASGARLAACNERGELQVRDVATGEVLDKLSHPTSVYAVAWHPDGIHVAVAGNDFNLYLWDTISRRQHAVLQGHGSDGIGLAFSQDGGLLLSHGWDGTSRLWDFWTGRQLLSLPGSYSQFSRDGQRLAIRRGSKLGIWEVTPGREYRTLPKRRAADNQTQLQIGYGDVSPDGRWLAAAVSDGVRLWDLALNEEHVLPLGVAGVTFHPSGQELFTSGGGLYRWPLQAESGVLRLGPPCKLPIAGGTGRAALDREGAILAAVSAAGASRIDLEKSPPVAVHLNHRNANDVTTSPDGRWVATGVHHGSGVKVWEAHSGKLVRHLLPTEEITKVAFSPDGRWLVTGTAAEFSFWEVGSWELSRTIPAEGGVDVPSSIVFARRGKLLAIALSHTVVQLLEAETGRRLARLQAADDDLVQLIGFSPDGSQLFVSSQSKFVHVWDLRLIRERLSELGLDWDLPPYPPPAPLGDGKRMKVEIDLGELALKR